MLDKLKQKIFPSDERIKALREVHAKSLELNNEARERLIVVCEIKKKLIRMRSRFVILSAL